MQTIDTGELVAFVKEALDRKQAELQLNDQEFAEYLGIDYTTLYRIRLGKSWAPSLKAMARIFAPPAQVAA